MAMAMVTAIMMAMATMQRKPLRELWGESSTKAQWWPSMFYAFSAKRALGKEIVQRSSFSE
eukprot:8426512-Alexandrium_andersonii.AAC.1